MPSGTEGKAGRIEPPPPEPPVWFPSLAQGRGLMGSPGRGTATGTMPKTRNMPIANTLRSGNDLFSISTLPQLDALELPGMARKKKVWSGRLRVYVFVGGGQVVCGTA